MFDGNHRLLPLSVGFLFMCSFKACKYKKACRDIYDRIVATCLRRGRYEREEDICRKLALIAVCNKILKQAFAIAKSETMKTMYLFLQTDR